jgi:hypothetical protein
LGQRQTTHDDSGFMEKLERTAEEVKADGVIRDL